MEKLRFYYGSAVDFMIRERYSNLGERFSSMNWLCNMWLEFDGVHVREEM